MCVKCTACFILHRCQGADCKHTQLPLQLLSLCPLPAHHLVFINPSTVRWWYQCNAPYLYFMPYSGPFALLPKVRERENFHYFQRPRALMPSLKVDILRMMWYQKLIHESTDQFWSKASPCMKFINLIICNASIVESKLRSRTLADATGQLQKLVILASCRPYMC